MKELVKGCKKNWSPYKKPQSDITIWANEVIKLGRAMMPNAILPTNYVYDDQTKQLNRPINKMVKELMDSRGEAVEVSSPIRKDPEDDRKVMRHTRSYYKKVSNI